MDITIKSTDLVNVFERFSDRGHVEIYSVTDADLLKKGRTNRLPLVAVASVKAEDVQKHARWTGKLGESFAGTVLNRLAQAGKDATDYKAGTSWHIPYHDSTVISAHKARPDAPEYFRLLVDTDASCKVEYRVGDKLIEKDVLSDYLPAPKARVENQGLEVPVQIRVLKLASVKELKVDGTTFKVID